MKKSLLAVVAFCTLFSLGKSALASTPVFQCVDNQRFLKIYDFGNGQLRGFFRAFGNGKVPYVTTQMSCTKSKSVYTCTRDRYIATAFRGSDGRITVQLELSGDFYPDSGYLYSLSCQ